MKPFVRYLILLVILLSGTLMLQAQRVHSAAPSVTQGEASSSPLPAPLPNAPQPTINLNVAHGLPGTVVTISGQGVSPYPGVRIVWLNDETTSSLAVAPVDAGQAYSTQVQVPSSAVAGPGRFCAAVTGTAQAAFACQNFTVDTPAPGSVTGQLPLSLNRDDHAVVINNPQVLDATVRLYDQQGNIIASAPVNNNGTFALNNVPPGSYSAGIVGIVPVVVQGGQVIVTAGGQATFNPIPSPQCQKGSVTAVRLSPTGKATSEFDFGSYVNYWPFDEAGPKVSFEVDVQLLSGTNLGLLEVRHDREDGSVALFTVVDPPAQGTTYQFSKWMATVDVGVRTFTFKPNVSGSPGCQIQQGSRRIHIIEHPMQPNAFQQYNDRRVNDLVWDGTHYVFDVKTPSTYNGFDFLIPYFPIDGEQKLPITYPGPPPFLPYLGEMENKLGGVAFHVVGTFDLDGNVTLRAVRSRSRSTLMSQYSVLNAIAPLFPEGGGAPAGRGISPQTNDIPFYGTTTVGTDLTEQLRSIQYDIGEVTLFDFDEEVVVYEGVLFSAVGLVNVRISVTLGVSGDMVLTGQVRPLAPSIDVGATTNVRPRVDIDLILDALFGVVSGGATTRTEAEMRFPMRLTMADPQYIWMPDPCMQIKVTLFFWARVNLLFASHSWNMDPEVLVDYREGACAARPVSTTGSPNDPPRIMAAPHITSDNDGRMLAVYIEDTTPDNAIPSPKVMARFWDSQSGQWGTPVALTNGSRMVQDPVAAFYGTAGQAMVAWSETVITPAEEQAATGLNDILKQQEIYYATWNGSQWSQPARLTNDELPDGQAAIAGDNEGITLAWMRDVDGNVATRTDWRIAVQQWDATNNNWSAVTLLNGHSSNAANYQVTADRQIAQNISRQVLAWTVDTDGELGTTGDRWLTIFEWNGSTWVKDPTNTLPLASDSPSIAYLPGGQDLALAFLRRVNDASGSDGGLGNNARLWSARRTQGSGWTKFEVVDENNEQVRAEQPQVAVGSNGEALIIFRRFGAVATYGELGQVALTRLQANGQAYPPLYLTDEPRQHWQLALGVDQATNDAVLLHVGRAVPGGDRAAEALAPLQPATLGARPTTTTTILSGNEDSLESVVVKPEADPALDPVMALSEYHAAAGSTVTVTVTLRNLGRAEATGLAVALYAGQPGSGSLLTTQPTAPLAFNEMRSISFQVTRSEGEMPLYAQIVTNGGNVSQSNDVATADLGALPPPALVRVDPSPIYPGVAQVAWQPPAVADIGGYRILRSVTPGGPYELVGETTATFFADLLPSSELTYYVVQTYDGSGQLSPLSDEVSFAAGARAYLPSILR